MSNDIRNTPDAATGNKLAADIADKRSYGQRWGFSPRHVDNLLAQGLPHLKIGERRVRIIVADADAWMRQRFSTQRRGPAHQTGRRPRRAVRRRSVEATQEPATA